LVAALASWLDARAQGGQWLVRVEDVDAPRCVEGLGAVILAQLAALGLVPDEAPVYQSTRAQHYQQALDDLINRGLAYPCRCSRKDIETALTALGQPRARGGELVYPGTCRESIHGHAGTAWRLRTDSDKPLSTPEIAWHDRRLGRQSQNVEQTVGDFPLKRADGCFTYQLAVVVDDAAQGITDVVRGEDLADNTARQILLQRALNLPTPRYLHVPLVLGENGEKLSKQNGAAAIDVSNPLAALNAAATALGLRSLTFVSTRIGGSGSGNGGGSIGNVAEALTAWVQEWRPLYNRAGD
jgi:glutamyl-Q tRNA(Asp) synthetase